MRLSQIRDYLKTIITSPNWYIGKIDAAKEQCIGIYNSSAGTTPIRALGGSSVDIKPIVILIHWGLNADTAEQKALEVYRAIENLFPLIEGEKVIDFRHRYPQPIPLNTDENGIYEYTIEIDLFYERMV